jgi:exopolysaccharide biosynthesis polyprenyl glycosylphosphotransferase
MSFKNASKRFALLLCDIAFLYLALFATLIIRYGGDFYGQFVAVHSFPFTIIFAIWIVIFYIAGLYELRHLRNNLDFIKILGFTIFVNSVIAVFFFYLIPAFGITPKTNLFIFIVIFACAELLWRRSFNRLIATGEAPNKGLLVGEGNTADVLYNTVHTTPQLGYGIKLRMREDEAYAHPEKLHALVLEHKLNFVVVSGHLKNSPALTKMLYGLLARGVEVRDLVGFYEFVLRKIPVADLEESWFLENLVNQQKFYDPLKRAWEFLGALVIGIVLLPVELLVLVLIKLTSRGSAIYKQLRVGKNGTLFTLYKFRTMYENAEKRGPQWADPNDLRATPLGKILRYTHIDELPQLLNVVKNEISFVGPRPERPEFVETLKEKIPYYEIRLLVKPGITGWAQINYKYGASVEDAYEKLQFDIYYLKNRSLVLDFAIILKTLKTFFINQK